MIDKIELIKSGKLTAEKNISNFLDKIKKENAKVNAVLSLNKNAISEAKEVDKKVKSGKSGKLAGLGFIIKSNICVKGLECNCASKTLEGWIAPYDATVISKIKSEDGIILGMANMDEFASGSSGETSAFGATKNPINNDLIPGGTSSGSATSVAMGFCDVALGSDTGGSNRNPASHCGVVGVKPSYGLVSRYGLIDSAMSFDQIGPLGNNVSICAEVLDVLKGKDEKDSISLESGKIKIESLKNKKIKIGVLRLKGVNKEIQDLIESRINEVCKKNNWNKKDIEIKYLDLGLQTYYLIVYTEFFSGTRKFDGRRFGKKIEDSCGIEVLRRIYGGSEITKSEYEGRYYKKALEVKEFIKREFEKMFKEVDCIISPTVPKLPHKLGTNISVREMYAYDSLTIPANLAGICAISIPAGKINNIPVGLQIMCGSLDESKMFSISKEFE